jgi:hypothetical protein
MSDARPSVPFLLVISDHDRGLFSVEGPMTGDRPWQSAVRRARDGRQQVGCGNLAAVGPALRVPSQPPRN